MNSKIQIIDQALIVCFLIFTISTNFSISLTQIASYGGFGLFLIRTHLAGTWNQVRFPLILPLGFFLFAAMISVATAVDPLLSVKFLKKFLNMVIFLWVANALANTHPRDFLIDVARRCKATMLIKVLEKWKDPDPVHASISFFLLMLVLSGTASALLSMYKTIAGGETLLYQLIGSPIITMGLRNSGALSDLLTFSGLLMLSLLLVTARYLFKKPMNHWLLIFISILILALVISLSRRTWVASTIVIVIFLFLYKRVLITLPLIALIFVFAFGPTPLKTRLFTIVDNQQHSNEERLYMWTAGWTITKDYPLTGCGLGCQFVIADQYPQFPILKKYTHMHSSPMQVLVEMGLLGFIFWLSIWVAYFRQLQCQWMQKDQEPRRKWIVISCAGAVLGFLISGAFENNFFDTEIISVVYFLLAVPFVRNPNPPAKHTT